MPFNSASDAFQLHPDVASYGTTLRLDGSTSLARRRYETALFNKPDGRHFVYLCSTRAGGLGINLQSADTVILADPDWNPTYDQQAQDRAHRLGQKRPVTVIRMCHASSVEEGILAVAAKKASLAAAVLAGLEAGADVKALDAANAASAQDPAAAAKLSFTELREIILAGAHAADAPAAFNDSKADANAKKKTRGGDPKTPAGKGGKKDAQTEGAEALARAAASSGKAQGHMTWEGRDYKHQANAASKKEIADLWVESIGTKKRERVQTIEYVDAGAGLGMQAVSRASIMEAREAEDRERRAAAAREAARSKATERAAKHETKCCGCDGEGVCVKPPPAFLAPDVAAERLRCRNCPRVMSMGCARLVVKPRMGWQCPQHHCKSCNRTASEAGGLMFRCVDCPSAFCAECNGDTPFDAVEGHPEWESMGFYLPKSFEYVRCNECVVSKSEREEAERLAANTKAKTRQGKTPGGADGKKTTGGAAAAVPGKSASGRTTCKHESADGVRCVKMPRTAGFCDEHHKKRKEEEEAAAKRAKEEAAKPPKPATAAPGSGSSAKRSGGGGGKDGKEKKARVNLGPVPGGRCAVCVIAKKGRCGTETAPKSCKRRGEAPAAPPPPPPPPVEVKKEKVKRLPHQIGKKIAVASVSKNKRKR